MKTIPRWLQANLVLVLLISLAGGAWFYRTQEKQIHRHVEDELEAIAQMKAGQINEWRANQLSEADELMADGFLAMAVERWLSNPKIESPEGILGRFRSLQRHYHYHDVLLTTAAGQVSLSLNGVSDQSHVEVLPALADAFRERKPILTDLHTCRIDPAPHIGVIVPLLGSGISDHNPLGAVVMVVEAHQFLYPLIQSWPTLSKSAETLVVRRDGDSALYLNDLRHQSGAALKLRIPLNNREVPAVMAVLGKSGIVDGSDYRGVEVIAAILRIPNSTWFLVAKVDADEAFAEWRFRSVLIIGLLLGMAILESTGALLIWQQNQKARFRELYQSEAILRASEERHGITLRSIGDAVIVTDADGRVELLNPAAEMLTGWGSDEAHGKSLEQVFRALNEESHQPAENSVARVLRSGATDTFRDQAVLIARDGKERFIARSSAGVFNERKEVTGAVLVFRDQTEERMAQRALQEQERKFREIVTFLDEGYCSVMMDGEILECNPAFNHLLGFDASYDLKGTMAPSFWRNPNDRKEYLSELIDKGFIRNYLVNVKTIREEELFVMINSHLVRDEKGAPLRIEGTYADITERKRGEDALRELNADLDRSNKELAQFAYVVSHDLQEPLRTVSSFAQLLGRRYEGKLDQDANDFIRYIVDGAGRMQQLIQDLLAYARITTRGSEFASINLQKALEEAISNLRSAIEESGAVLTHSDMPVIKGDFRQLVQVFQNLLGNAIKFRIKDQSPRVHISAEKSGSEWIVSVKDNGIGIDSQYFHRLFTIFQRLHGRQEYSGTGIGLAICQRIMARHGGRIWVESAPGEGSTFRFSVKA